MGIGFLTYIAQALHNCLFVSVWGVFIFPPTYITAYVGRDSQANLAEDISLVCCAVYALKRWVLQYEYAATKALGAARLLRLGIWLFQALGFRPNVWLRFFVLGNSSVFQNKRQYLPQFSKLRGFLLVR